MDDLYYLERFLDVPPLGENMRGAPTTRQYKSPVRRDYTDKIEYSPIVAKILIDHNTGLLTIEPAE